jgi:hypothetical protein
MPLTMANDAVPVGAGGKSPEPSDVRMRRAAENARVRRASPFARGVLRGNIFSDSPLVGGKGQQRGDRL